MTKKIKFDDMIKEAKENKRQLELEELFRDSISAVEKGEYAFAFKRIQDYCKEAPEGLLDVKLIEPLFKGYIENRKFKAAINLLEYIIDNAHEKEESSRMLVNECITNFYARMNKHDERINADVCYDIIIGFGEAMLEAGYINSHMEKTPENKGELAVPTSDIQLAKALKGDE